MIGTYKVYIIDTCTISEETFYGVVTFANHCIGRISTLAYICAVLDTQQILLKVLVLLRFYNVDFLLHYGSINIFGETDLH